MPSNRPLLVGITGGIGAGKSIVSKVFQILGIPKYDADSRAKVLMNSSPELVKPISLLFGPEAYKNDHLNRQYIAAKAFENKGLLTQLNELVHPAVANDFNEWVDQQTAPYVLKEAALLFESGSFESLDQMITVTAPKDIRIKRVMARDGRTEYQVKSIISNQMSEGEKANRSDYVIENDDENMVIPQVLEIHSTLMQNIYR